MIFRQRHNQSSNGNFITIMLRSFLLAVSMAGTSYAGDHCDLCSVEHRSFWGDAIIKTDGTTCGSLALEMAVNFPAGSQKCDRYVESWQLICCSGDSPPKDMPVTPTPAPVTQGVGQYGPICNLCPAGNKPNDPYHVINMLRIDGNIQSSGIKTADTCISYHDAGLRGQIPSFLCDTLQFFAYHACACEPKPGQAPEENEQRATPFPTPLPTPLPTPIPTPLPTVSNTVPVPAPLPTFATQRPVPVDEGKSAVKMSSQRGGAGGGQHHSGRVRRLKGGI